MPTSSQDEKDAAAKQAAKRQLSQAPAVGPKDDDDAASDEQKKPASLGDAKSKEKAKGVGIQYVPVPKSNTAVTAAASSSSPPVEDEESSDAKKPAAKNVQLTDDQLKARAKSSMVSQAPALDPSEEASKKESQLTQQEKDKIAKKQAAAGRMTAAADQGAGQTQPGPGAYKYEAPPSSTNNNRPAAQQYDSLYDFKHGNAQNDSSGAAATTAGAGISSSVPSPPPEDTTSSPHENTGVPVAQTIDEKELRDELYKEIVDNMNLQNQTNAHTYATATAVEHVDVDANAQDDGNKEAAPNRRKLWIGLVILVVIVAAVVGGVVASSGGGDSDGDDETQKNSDRNNILPEDDETTSTDVPSASPTTSAPTTYADKIFDLVASYSGDEQVLDPTLAQHQGWQWLGGDASANDWSDDILLKRYALATLYYATSGFNWDTVEFLLLGTSYCSWYGVTCNADGDPIRLELSNQNMQGNIPPELGILTSLELIDITGNLLTGSIPSEIGFLTSLTKLDFNGRAEDPLGGVAVNGNRGLRSLQGRSPNAFSGSIPSEIGLLTNMRELRLEGNALEDNIPSEIGMLQELQYLSLANNNLSDAIPLQIGFLRNLRYLSLDRNPNLSGFVPNAFCASDSVMEELSSDCFASGSVSCKCCNICCSSDGECIDVDVTPSPSVTPSAAPSDNPSDRPSLRPSSTPSRDPTQSPSGTPSSSPTNAPTTPVPTPSPTTSFPSSTPTTPFPTSTPSAIPTRTPTIFETPAPTGEPTSFSDAVFQFAASISNPNDILTSGTPQNEAFQWFAQDALNNDYDSTELVQRYVMAVLYHSTSGDNWNRRNRMNMLSTARVCDNWATNKITCVGTVIDQMDFTGTNLDGTIPSELWYLTSLRHLDFDDNSLRGSIPSQMGSMTSLTYLNLIYNDLSSSIPTELGWLTNLQYLILGYNELTGPLPTEIGNLGRFSTMVDMVLRDNL